ncbi:subunit of tubulin prefoldin [Dimargaris verticillata]|uniref:Subunit of tubulin prefoldin n=1 Tax=Dimargaris verticillata TaxID=2761393 RepID=A0A9W8E7K3_9FUNG|nr:subunit of tubulin prefoldin [Dimargaris verticillata]
MSDPQAQPSVNLADLALPQLQQVKGQLEEELNYFTGSYSRLKQAQATFRECKRGVEALTPNAAETTALIPLTTSLYVPGKLSDINTVIVDLGTGYYAEKSTTEAKKFYDEKTSYVQTQLDKLQASVTEKQNNLRLIVDVMKYKLTQKAAQEDKASA